MIILRLGAFVCAIVPILVWHQLNKVYPTADQAEYLTSLLTVYNKLSSSLTEGLGSMYFDRIWKPIFFPFVGLPFIFLSQGNIESFLLIWGCFCQIFTCHLLIETLKPKINDLMATTLSVFICLTPSVVAMNLQFMTESALSISLLSCFYACTRFKSEIKTKYFIYFLVSYSLAMLVRPLEGFFLLSPSLFIVFRDAYFQKKITTTSILISFLGMFSFLILFLILLLQRLVGVQYVTLNDDTIIILLSFIYLIQIFVFFLKKEKSLNIYVISTVLISFIVAAWYVGFLSQLAYWIYECTFGPITRNMISLSKASLFFSLAQNSGLIVLVISFIFFNVFSKKNETNRNRNYVYSFVIPAILLVFLGLNTQNEETRYYVPSIVILYLSLLVIKLPRDTILYKRYLVLGFFFIFIYCLSHLRAFTSHSSLQNIRLPFNDISAPNLGVDYNYELYRVLRQKIDQNSRVLILDIGNANYQNFPPTVDVFNLFKFKLLAQDFNDKTSYLSYHSDSAKFNTNILEIINEFDNVLVGPLEYKPDKLWPNGSEALGLYLIENFNKGVATINLKHPETMRLKINDKLIISFLLFKVNH